MLKISAEQIAALGWDWRERLREERVADVAAQLRAKGGEVVKDLSTEQLRGTVGDVLDAGQRFGVTQPEQLLNWAYIRLALGEKFWEMPEFKDVLEHPYLHGDAKGRHIVLSFFAVNKMLARAK